MRLTRPALPALPTPELRGGDWTRYAGQGAWGDSVTEQTLSALAEPALDAARARGYAMGWTEGHRQAAAEARAAADQAAYEAADAEARRESEHAAAVRLLHEAARSLQGTAAVVAERLEAGCLDLAVELTEVIVGHQLRTAADPTGDLRQRIAAALAVLPDGVAVTVRAHPQRAPGLRAPLHDLGADLVEDPALGPHDAVVETDRAHVDLAIGAALARVREVLR